MDDDREVWTAPGSWPSAVPEVKVQGLIQRGSGHRAGYPDGPAGSSRHQEVVGFAGLLSKSLLLAVAENNLSVVKTCLEQKADPDACVNEDGNSALHLAVSGGVVEAVQSLLWAKACPINMNEKGLTPLDCAVMLGDGRCVAVLLLEGGSEVWAPLDRAEKHLGQTLLTMLSGIPDQPREDDLSVLRNLFLRVNTTKAQSWLGLGTLDDDVYTRYLFASIVQGWLGGVVALLEIRVDPNSTDRKSQRTAFEFAAAICDHRAAGALRAMGALAVMNPGHAEWATAMAAASGSRKAFDRWIGVGDPDWREPGGDGFTALMYAAGEGDLYAAKRLVKDARANPMLRDYQGRKAADIARARGHNRLGDWLEQVAQQWKEPLRDAPSSKGAKNRQDVRPEDGTLPEWQDIKRLASQQTNGELHAASSGGLLSLLGGSASAAPGSQSTSRLAQEPDTMKWLSLSGGSGGGWSDSAVSGRKADPTIEGADRIVEEVSYKNVGSNVDPGSLQIKIVAVRNLPMNWVQSMDPVVKVRLAQAGSRILGPIVAQTQVIRDVRVADVEWNEQLPDIQVQGDEQIICTAWDDNSARGGVLYTVGMVADDYWADALIGRIVIPLWRYSQGLLSGEHFRITQRMMMQEAEHGEAELVVEFGLRPKGDGGGGGWFSNVDEHLEDDYSKFF